MIDPIQYDPITGLPDRAYLWSLLKDTLIQIRRNASSSGVLLIEINDLHGIGELVGEGGKGEFLQLMASRLKNCLWDLDSAVHFEDNKFVIVANSIQKQEDIHIVMTKVRDYLALDCEIGGIKISPSTSIGIVLVPTDSVEADEIMTSASTAKPKGDDSFCYFNQDLGERIAEQEVIKASILETLATESFVLVLQPKIDTKTRAICGVEALVRMRDSEGNIVTPDEFIPVAENSNLILKIGDWVLAKTQAISAEWKAQGIDLPISVNISDVQFKNGASLLSTLHDLTASDGNNADNVILEISENIITHDVALASALMSEIKSYGYKLSIDGFGSGFSSLSVLRDLKVDEIKIDRHFLNDVPADEKSTAILKSIIMLGKSMDFRVVVMGVESEEQFEILKEHNCDEFQGFLISEPIEEENFANWYKNYKV